MLVPDLKSISWTHILVLTKCNQLVSISSTAAGALSAVVVMMHCERAKASVGEMTLALYYRPFSCDVTGHVICCSGTNEFVCGCPGDQINNRLPTNSGGAVWNASASVFWESVVSKTYELVIGITLQFWTLILCIMKNEFKSLREYHLHLTHFPRICAIPCPPTEWTPGLLLPVCH